MYNVTNMKKKTYFVIRVDNFTTSRLTIMNKFDRFRRVLKIFYKDHDKSLSNPES